MVCDVEVVGSELDRTCLRDTERLHRREIHVGETRAADNGSRCANALTTFNAYVSDGYFATIGIPVLRGRGFLESDVKGSPQVAVVNEHAAKHLWPAGDAIGKGFHLHDASGDLVQVVGIAKTAKYFWIAEPPLDYIYLPVRQHPRTGLSLFAESNATDASALAPVLRQVVHGLDPDMPVFDVRTMHDLFTQRAVKTPNMLSEIVGPWV